MTTFHKPFAMLATALALAGCASADVVCNMKIDYERTTPMAREGSVVLVWRHVDYVPNGSNAIAYCGMGVCNVILKNDPGFGDVCQLARLGHELEHAMGATHVPR